jgi:hypothetical protein
VCIIAFCIYILSCDSDSPVPNPGALDELDTPTDGNGSEVITATSVMIYAAGPADYMISGSQVYRMNRVQAAAYFTNSWNGNPPIITATGWCATHGGCSCPPETPPPPRSLESRLEETVLSNKCIFWNGGILTGTTYTQSVSISVTSGSDCEKGTWTFTYTYSVRPTGSGEVPDHTAWEITSFGPSSPLPVTLDGTRSYIASESAIDKPANKTGWSRKYSFSLSSDRIQNLTVTMTDANNNVYPPSSGTPGISSFVSGLNDFTYVHNTTSGSCIIIDNAAPDDIQNGIAGGYENNGCPSSNTPGGKDNFPGNDNLGATKGFLNTMTWNLLPGNYRLRISATVKGLEGAADVTFEKCSGFTITADCQLGNCEGRSAAADTGN